VREKTGSALPPLSERYIQLNQLDEQEKDQEFVFLTNNISLTPFKIAMLYKGFKCPLVSD